MPRKNALIPTPGACVLHNCAPGPLAKLKDLFTISVVQQTRRNSV